MSFVRREPPSDSHTMSKRVISITASLLPVIATLFVAGCSGEDADTGPSGGGSVTTGGGPSSGGVPGMDPMPGGGTTFGTGGDTASGGINGTGAADGSGGETGDDFDCVLPDLPEAGDLPDLGMKLPDPFTFYDGTKVTTRAQWECRRKEILAMAAKYLYGPVPGEPDEVTGTVSGGTVNIDVTVGSKTESFTANISGNGDVIAVRLENSGMAPQGSKSLSFGSGNEAKIGNLFGISGINANIARGWMIDRVMDVLEANPGSGHDPTKIMVTGCSGCGKGAFLAGVFSRVPLTVIVESGGGGATSWRMTQWFRSGQGNWNCGDLPQGIGNLENNGICGPWVSDAAQPFRNNPALVNHLPFDQHLLIATIAPRYLVHFTNNNGAGSWCHLAGTSEALAAWAAYPVYEALGVPERMSFEVYDGGHCSTADTGIAAAMFDRVFNGNMSAATGGVRIQDGRVQQPVSQWPSTWIDWDMDTVLQ